MEEGEEARPGRHFSPSGAGQTSGAGGVGTVQGQRQLLGGPSKGLRGGKTSVNTVSFLCTGTPRGRFCRLRLAGGKPSITEAE